MMTRLILALCLALTALPARAEVLILAAASLREPLDALAEESQTPVVVSYGGSGTMARQVVQGAPAEIVVLASLAWMEVLAEEGVLSPDVPPADVARNRLVLVAQAGHPPVPLTEEGIAQALGAEGRLALGLVEAVPAGIYAKAALESLGLWEGLEDRLAEAENVRAALALVERGQAPLGITYVTDAAVSPAVTVVAEVPEESHPPVRYIAALTRDAGPEARAFFDRMIGAEGAEAFAAAGFQPVPR